ncbi:hypothetical protein BDW42DRAFT_163717 [Aspergillus taichungensis]|uniref:Uncharacterized protein n=1 Tax=Aspergillus taichungensis TaxID=482145 RepID=A0A2J5I2G5_9EURO|nr:hypothetical protein BDW42DRAFT_163717 [Aspergillus taichungensis]
MTDSLIESAGFALRINGSCLPEQVDCGATTSPFRVCCPGGTQCPDAYNVACCPSEANCTSTLLESPRCADRSWDLYDNDGYFCCDKDTTGFARLGNSDGCAVPGYSFHEDDKLLSVVLSAKASTTEPSTSLMTATDSEVSATMTPIPTPTLDTESPEETNDRGHVAGSIVGGIVGIGIISGLVWFLLARRSKSKEELAEDSDFDSSPQPEVLEGHVVEADGSRPPVELGANEKQAAPVELPSEPLGRERVVRFV